MRSLSSIVKSEMLLYKQSDHCYCDRVELKALESLMEKRETIIRQAIRKAKYMEEEAAKKAEFLIAEAENNSGKIAEKAKSEGYQEGYKRGLLEGQRAAEAAVAGKMKEINSLLDSIKTEKWKAIRRQEEEFIRLAFKVAEKIMKQQLIADEAAIVRMIEEAAREKEEVLKIYISENQSALGVCIDREIAESIEDSFKNAKVVLVQKEDVIMLETETGFVDISIPVQLEQLRQAVI